MIVLIDNYDSFTFNLVHYFGELGADVVVHRNDKVTAAPSSPREPDAIVLSPGPCTPKEAGICLDLIKHASADHPDPRRLPRPSGDRRCLRRQGRPRAGSGARQAVARSTTTAKAFFAASTAPFKATRYHSLVSNAQPAARTHRHR